MCDCLTTSAFALSFHAEEIVEADPTTSTDQEGGQENKVLKSYTMYGSNVLPATAKIGPSHAVKGEKKKRKHKRLY